jgi:protease-4
MGNVAASGGYYISCGANKIYASPATVTGSIGIFTGKFVFTGLFNLIGINRETFKRGEHADLFSIDKELNEKELEFLYKKISGLYDIFITKVAMGRGLDKQKVDDIGQGRVWMGSQAKGIKLIDEFGGIYDAVEEVRRLVQLPKSEPIQLIVLPELGFFDKLRNFVTASDGPTFFTKNTKEIWQFFGPFFSAFKSYEPLAIMPYAITIE